MLRAICNFDMLQETEDNLVFVKKYCEISQKYWSIWKIWPLATEPGSGSGLEDSDPLTDQIPRPKDPDPDSVGFGFVPCTNSVG
jgi:hypothetical protein